MALNVQIYEHIIAALSSSDNNNRFKGVGGGYENLPVCPNGQSWQKLAMMRRGKSISDISKLAIDKLIINTLDEVRRLRKLKEKRNLNN